MQYFHQTTLDGFIYYTTRLIFASLYSQPLFSTYWFNPAVWDWVLLTIVVKNAENPLSHIFSPVELRQATVAMMNRKDELEEQNAYVEKFCFSDAYRHADVLTL